MAEAIYPFAAVAHGDPLPANLLLSEHGECVLLDFEFTGLFAAGFDLAMLHTLLVGDPGAGVRVRLHLYTGGHYDRPHNHRWPFASCILGGRYRHRIFGDDTGFDEQADAAALRPIVDRYETAGAMFALDHRSVHAVDADRDTVSVIVRGPAAKDQFLIHDVDAGGFFHVRGAAQETPKQRASKQLTGWQLTDSLDSARRLVAGTGKAGQR